MCFDVILVHADEFRCMGNEAERMFGKRDVPMETCPAPNSGERTDAVRKEYLDV